MRGGLKVLSGAQVVDILADFGFAVIGGTKHIKLRRYGPNGKETLVVQNRSPLTNRKIKIQKIAQQSHKTGWCQ